MKNEPEKDIGLYCRDPYECAFWGYCTEKLPKPYVFDLYRMNFEKALSHYYNGQISYND